MLQLFTFTTAANIETRLTSMASSTCQTTNPMNKYSPSVQQLRFVSRQPRRDESLKLANTEQNNNKIKKNVPA